MSNPLIAAWQQPYVKQIEKINQSARFESDPDEYMLKKQAQDSIERLCHEVQRRDLLLQSMTPGGSEYVMNPERCAEFVLGVKRSLYNQVLIGVRRIVRLQGILTLLGYSE